MMKRSNQRILSWVLTLAMLLTLVPMGLPTVGAAGTEAETLAEWTTYSAPTAPISASGGENMDGAQLNTTANYGTNAGYYNSTGWDTFSDDPKYWSIELSTAGYEGLTLSFKSRASNTGPRDFAVQYSTTGEEASFTTVETYGVKNSGAATDTDFTFDLSDYTALNNADKVYLRLMQTSGTSVNGGSPGSAGTCRIWDLAITGTAFAGEPTNHKPPTFSIIGGTSAANPVLVSGGKWVTLGLHPDALLAGAEIWYTTSDTVDLTTEEGTWYNADDPSAIFITGPTKISAVVRSSSSSGGDLEPSAVVTYYYDVATSHAAPTFTPAGGASDKTPTLVPKGSTVTLTPPEGAATGAMVYYALSGDSDDLTEDGTEYDAPIPITGPTKIRAVVRDNGGNLSPSDEVTAYYNTCEMDISQAITYALVSGNGGKPVTITGVVTCLASSNNNYYIEDATGGILAYGAGFSSYVGKTIKFESNFNGSATTNGCYNGAPELSGITWKETVSENADPQPLLTTITDIMATGTYGGGLSNLTGRYVKLVGLTVTEISGGTYTVKDNADDTIKVYTGNSAIDGIAEGDRVEAIGAVTYHSTHGIQISARSPVADSFTKLPAAATPTATPAGGSSSSAPAEIGDNADVTVTSDAGATIHYTLDGNDPTTSSVNVASGSGITLDFDAGNELTLKLLAVADNKSPSAIATYYYMKAGSTLTAKTPTANPVSGATVENGATVTLTSDTSGATIYYTLDGEVPTTSSTEYTAPFALDFGTETSLTVKAIAVYTDMHNSEIATFTYTKYAPYSGEGVFEKITSVTEVVPGGKYVLYNPGIGNGNPPARAMSNWCTSASGGGNMAATDISSAVMGDLIIDPSDTLVWELRTTETAGVYNLYSAQSNKYLLSWNSASAAFTMQDSPASIQYPGNNDTKQTYYGTFKLSDSAKTGWEGAINIVSTVFARGPMIYDAANFRNYEPNGGSGGPTWFYLLNEEITLDKEPQPNASISYLGQKLIGLTGDAKYWIAVGDVGSAATAGSDGSIAIDDAWIGKTITITTSGNGTTTKNSDPQTLIIKSRPIAPIGLSATPTTDGGDDGIISGVTTAMEYREKSATNWTDCPTGTINGLAVGEYEVRYKATASEFSSEIALVTVLDSNAIKATAYEMTVAEWKMTAETPKGVDIKKVDATDGEYKAGATLEMLIGGVAQATGNATNSTTAGLFISDYGWSTYSSPAFAYNTDSSKSAQWVVKTTSTNLTNLEFSFSMYATAAGPRDFDIEVSINGTDWTKFADYQLAEVNTMVSFKPGDLLQQTISNQTSVWFRAVVSSPTRYSGASGAISGNYSANNFKVTGKYIDFADRVNPVMPNEQGAVLLNETITLTSGTADAAIEYSLDEGTTWKSYSDGVTLDKLPCTLYAKATKADLTESFVTKFAYTQKQLGAVVSSNPSGSVPSGTEIILTRPEGADEIKYDITTKMGATGQEKTTKDQLYSDPIVLVEEDFPYLIKAWAVGTNYKNGEPVTFSYGMKRATRELFFGQLHSHTTLSDGAGTVEAAFVHARDVAKLDFFAVTDHSNSFGGDSTTAAVNTLYLNSDGTNAASNATNENWLHGKKAAADARNPNFASFYGYEMTWSGGPGHINTFNTEGWVSRNNTALNDKASDNGMRAYYDLLARTPDSISQLNHPGTTFGNFTNFSYYKPEYDDVIKMVEVGNGEGAIGTGGYFPSYEQYTMALDKGWHVAPTNNQDNHKGLWGTANDARDVILTDDLSEQGVYEALRELRCYATEVKDLRILYEVDGAPLGTVFPEVPPTATFTARIENPTAGNTVKSVELITNGGVSLSEMKENPNTRDYDYEKTMTNPVAGYYYLRVTVSTPSGDRFAVTAPVWLGVGKMAGISEVTRSVAYPVTNEGYSLTTEIFNSESAAVTLLSLKLDQNGVVLENFPNLNQTIAPNTTYKKTITTTPTAAGDVTMTATAVIRYADNAEQTYTFSMDYEILADEKLTYIGVDGSHYNEYVAGNYKDNVTNFANLAMDYGVRVVTLTTSEQLIAATENPQYKALIISPPSRRLDLGTALARATYSEAELNAIAAFAADGGTVALAGWSNTYENYTGNSDMTAEQHMAAQQNKILAAIGSTLRIGDDAAADSAPNPGKKAGNGDTYRLFLNDERDCYLWDNNSWLLTDVDPLQEYSQYGGSTVYTVAPGDRAQWNAAPSKTVPESVIPAVVLPATGSSENRETSTIGTTNYRDDYTKVGGRNMVLASETVTHDDATTSQVIVSGGLFMTNFEVDFATPDNLFDAYANRMIAINLVRSVEPVADITPIAEVKTLPEGTKVTIEAIVTSSVHAAGSPDNTGFFDCIYAQDELGNGINLFPVASGVAEGQKIRVTGTVSGYQGETQIQVKRLVVTDRSIQKQTPATLTTAASMRSDYTGRLVKLTGVVSNIVRAGDIVGQFSLNDGSGPALIYLNSYITPGVNLSLLRNGATVTVTGLASFGENYADSGFLPRIRVRDRNEIVFVSPPSTGNSGDSGSSATPDTPDSSDEPSVVIQFPADTVTPSTASDEQAAQAQAAVQELAQAKREGSGAEITVIAPPIVVSGGTDTSKAKATLILPETVDTTQISTMAMLNEDGSLTAVPTRIDENGNVVVLVSGEVTLVPLKVEANFTDIVGLAHVTDEVNRAASLMLVEGRGGGVFDPTALVTEREAVTVFLRAMGVPNSWDSAWETSEKHGLRASDDNPADTMTRIDTAALIVAAMTDLGMKPAMTLENADKALQGFTDLDGLSDAERINLAICVELKIYQGQGGGIMNPTGALQRSAIASLAVRLQDVLLGK